ncbi:hypothetical protein B0H14DRAFT_3543993, partial [Mycena olivaceomarginata]
MTHLHPLTAVMLALLLASSCCAELVSFRPPPLHKCNVSGPAKQPDPLADNSELLDIVLLASVDGKFHALNRTTGHTLWSMSSFSSSSSMTVSPLSSLVPLVCMRYINQDPDLTDNYLDACQETYIIEPQSGDIYVAATPSSPLQRFPYSMSELVDMSPFSFAAGDDHRVFVGRKATAEVVVELATGEVRFGGGRYVPVGSVSRLGCTGWARTQAAEAQGGGGRQDRYTIMSLSTLDCPADAIESPRRLSRSRPTGQAAGDNVLQGSYRSTQDGVYMQSLPNGELVAFKTGSKEDPRVRWGREFKSPIVAIFDVLRSPARDTFFVLLQPRPLYTILRNLVHTTSMDQLIWAKQLTGYPDHMSWMDRLPHLDSVYVGLVGATGSLFAMSPDRFPLVAVSGAGQGRVKLETALAGGEPKQRSYGSEDEGGAERCLDRSSRRRLVGMHPLEAGDEDGPQYRLKQLIDGVPGVVRGDHR